MVYWRSRDTASLSTNSALTAVLDPTVPATLKNKQQIVVVLFFTSRVACARLNETEFHCLIPIEPSGPPSTILDSLRYQS